MDGGRIYAKEWKLEKGEGMWTVVHTICTSSDELIKTFGHRSVLCN